ncbi:MAG TPA: helix-turn-helix domain-containing protein [Acidiferrobacterales bacterium]|nr:helix-turn-helix domain-containing protein [Acidiferrobacterales bacterium]
MKKPKSDQLITLAQAEEIYGLGANYLQKMAKRGRLKATKMGMQWFTTPEDVEIYIKSRMVVGVYRKDIKI